MTTEDRMAITIDALAGGLDPEQGSRASRTLNRPSLKCAKAFPSGFFEESGAFGFPRMGIEAEAGCWDDRRLQAAFTFPDGRALNGAARGAPPSAIDAEGRPTIIGAGPLTFRCIEPFRRWTMAYEGNAGSTAWFRSRSIKAMANADPSQSNSRST